MRALLTSSLGSVRKPTPMTLALAALLLLLADWGSQVAGDSVVPGGPLDESAHLLTTLLVIWALGPAIVARFLGSALVASVAIDLDHVPQHLGTQFLTAGTPRPYTHSLLTILVVLVLAVAWRPRRRVLCGVVLGLAVHFWRDLGEPGTGVSLLWPVSDGGFSVPHWSYLAVMTFVVAGVVWRLAGHRRTDVRPRARAAYKAAD